MPDVDDLLTQFDLRARRDGYDAAMAWLTGPDCAAHGPQKAAAVFRIGRRNLAAIRVGHRDLTTNRRRPGSFE